MSDGFRQRFEGSAEYDVWQYIAQHPGLTSGAIATGISSRHKNSIDRALRSLRTKGIIYNDGALRDKQAWHLSHWGEECYRNGLVPRAASKLDEPGQGNWTPKPWVHPIRARALGLK